MPKRAVFPPALMPATGQPNMSPGLVSGDYVFVTGMTGSDPQGRMPTDPETQFRAAFHKIGLVLNEAGLNFRSVVEMTSYHIGLRTHFELFDTVRLDYLSPPYPAWTAVGVAELRREGAIVEVRVIASTHA